MRVSHGQRGRQGSKFRRHLTQGARALSPDLCFWKLLSPCLWGSPQRPGSPLPASGATSLFKPLHSQVGLTSVFLQ